MGPQCHCGWWLCGLCNASYISGLGCTSDTHLYIRTWQHAAACCRFEGTAVPHIWAQPCEPRPSPRCSPPRSDKTSLRWLHELRSISTSSGTGNVPPERETSPQHGKRPPRTGNVPQNGKRPPWNGKRPPERETSPLERETSPRTGNVPLRLLKCK